MYNLAHISNILMMKEHVYNHVIINMFIFKNISRIFVLSHAKILNIFMKLTIIVATNVVLEYIKYKTII